MSLWTSVTNWVELAAGVLLIITGAVKWFVAEPPGPRWVRGTGSREVRRKRGRAHVILGVGLVLLVASSFATAANHPVLGAPLTLVAVVLLITSVVLNVRTTMLERGSD